MGVERLSVPHGTYTELLEFLPLNETEFVETDNIKPDDLLFKNRFIVGLIVGADEAKALNKKLQTVLPEHLREEGVFTFSGAQDNTKLIEWLEGRIRVAVEEMIGAFFRSQQALAETRRRNHMLQNNLMSLENAFASFGYPGRKVSFQTTDKIVFAFDVGDETGEIGFLQKIPVHLSNVVGIALFFRRSGRGQSGELYLKITKQFSHEIVCEQKINFEDIRRGWNEFECSPKEFERSEPLVIELTITGNDAEKMMPALARGASSIQDRVHLKSGRALAYPLAIRVFSGLAGVPYKRKIAAEAVNAEVPRLKSILSEDVMATAHIYELPYDEPSFRVVDFDKNIQSLLVHPLGSAPVVAQLKRVKAPVKCLISAVIEHRNVEGGPVDFGIYVVKNSLRPPSFSKDFFGVSASSKVGDAFVDLDKISWVRLNGGEWSELETQFFFEGGVGERDVHIDIFLLTRSPSGNSHLAWAMFRNISISTI
ncbi:MAG: DUF6212 domain-containing protein [Arachidicoccus sp.]|nr:DUF6212 domain-containing protein [Arachidicoccus sp.]